MSYIYIISSNIDNISKIYKYLFNDIDRFIFPNLAIYLTCKYL